MPATPRFRIALETHLDNVDDLPRPDQYTRSSDAFDAEEAAIEALEAEDEGITSESVAFVKDRLDGTVSKLVLYAELVPQYTAVVEEVHDDAGPDDDA
jgi:hypothetical protein